MKAFFFDVDGTLLPKFYRKIPEETVEVLNRLKENDHKVVLCTGRGLTELGFTDFRFDGYILLNGQLCLDENMEPYFVNPIKGSNLDELIKRFKECRVPFVLTEKDRSYMNFHNDFVREVSREISLPPHPVMEYEGAEIYMATVYAQSKISIGSLKTDRWHGWAFDIYPDGGGKQKGMQEFCQKYRIEVKDTVAFGDAENDIEMVKMAGIGVAMGNSYESVKQIADYVTADADDGGIVKALKHLELL